MATPMTADQWLRALRAEGVTDIVEMPGWRTNNRNRIKAFTDVHATMVHHTAGEGAGLPALLFKGRADLPGPLCHDYLTRTGRLYLVGNGRANHAGTVARNAYDAVLNERPTHPSPDAAEPLDGNSLSYGLEVENSGVVGRDWTAKQYDVAVRVQAARCRFHRWSANSVWAHKEATRRKPVDPRIPMNAFRAAVAERLEHEPGWNPGEEEADMPLTKADVATIFKTDGVIGVPEDWSPGNSEWTAASLLIDMGKRLRSLQANDAAQTAAIAALASALGRVDEAVDVDALVAKVRAAVTEAVESIDVRLDVAETQK
ncbi:N-acetylmuramoyl-L-alanine amidase [Streptomyces phaeochromogenes]|uniref:peptidoglycan recognition protein family protein n=1 Tax=Streptomyces phaeochromogenes TaxID=1923 RepID=UPI002DDC1C95|nr:N-acetylmuramoyl-L-alanine amidase [Streptomyces phaeochromogenes]WRZ32196.1 N-acetylmuramoyl-L-alanine amidase [Streptomyces phaeochromogenes]